MTPLCFWCRPISFSLRRFAGSGRASFSSRRGDGHGRRLEDRSVIGRRCGSDSRGVRERPRHIHLYGKGWFSGSGRMMRGGFHLLLLRLSLATQVLGDRVTRLKLEQFRYQAKTGRDIAGCEQSLGICQHCSDAASLSLPGGRGHLRGHRIVLARLGEERPRVRILLTTMGGIRLGLGSLTGPPLFGGIPVGLCLGSLAARRSSLGGGDLQHMNGVLCSLFSETVERHTSIKPAPRLAVGLPQEGSLAGGNDCLRLSPFGRRMYWRTGGCRPAPSLCYCTTHFLDLVSVPSPCLLGLVRGPTIEDEGLVERVGRLCVLFLGDIRLACRYLSGSFLPE